MTGCGMQQARGAVAEKPVEVVRNHEDGTSESVGTDTPRALPQGGVWSGRDGVGAGIPRSGTNDPGLGRTLGNERARDERTVEGRKDQTESVAGEPRGELDGAGGR